MRKSSTGYDSYGTYGEKKGLPSKSDLYNQQNSQQDQDAWGQSKHTSGNNFFDFGGDQFNKDQQQPSQPLQQEANLLGIDDAGVPQSNQPAQPSSFDFNFSNDAQGAPNLNATQEGDLLDLATDMSTKPPVDLLDEMASGPTTDQLQNLISTTLG